MFIGIRFGSFVLFTAGIYGLWHWVPVRGRGFDFCVAYDWFRLGFLLTLICAFVYWHPIWFFCSVHGGYIWAVALGACLGEGIWFLCRLCLVPPMVLFAVCCGRRGWVFLLQHIILYPPTNPPYSTVLGITGYWR